MASGNSLRRIAKLLNLNKNTVPRKLQFLGLRARLFNLKFRLQKIATEVQFDDLETSEHTKLKPLSVTLAVEKHSRFILGFEVSRMPAKGLLVKRALKKYGARPDERALGRERLFKKIKPQIHVRAIIESDSNPHYPEDVKRHFPEASHVRVLGARGSIGGQGELKKIKFDPLFSLNHTCAMLRANINRLIRKTWNTTKKMQGLIDHLDIYVAYHNAKLLN